MLKVLQVRIQEKGSCRFRKFKTCQVQPIERTCSTDRKMGSTEFN